MECCTAINKEPPVLTGPALFKLADLLESQLLTENTLSVHTLHSSKCLVVISGDRLDRSWNQIAISESRQSLFG